MANRRYRLHPMTRLFLGMLTLTLVVWVLRGVALLAFFAGYCAVGFDFTELWSGDYEQPAAHTIGYSPRLWSPPSPD